jgi:hypothetical protein
MRLEKSQRLTQPVQMDHVALLLLLLEHVALVEQNLEQQLAPEQEVELELEPTIDIQDQGLHHKNGHSYLVLNIQQHTLILNGHTLRHGVELVLMLQSLEADGLM